ncbi:hydroxyacylglutathione hydrolase [Melghirimyces profundicolus]|uniref:Hydroxyacylglutathione hydrolase n=1 Tax=Melghirimyces profundicolus TaxID=1242148 RepID=A0A2T6C4S2_9BACL|nr:rhodanese-like domain-containing protein [Melghirimyces profundicolus]PTX63292.1 hydroxyacylglutathione hydrolase [Melghirimyces profundicolus]
MILRYFYNDKLAHASYLVGCPATGEAIVIDPGRDVEPYLKAARKEGLKVVAAAETHIHADYVSGARELADRGEAKLYLSGEGEGKSFPYAKELHHEFLQDGDRFSIGNLTLEAMHTPGHTPEHLSYLLTDGGAEDPMGIFTGDFVFFGDVGRPDLLEKSLGVSGSADAGAEAMFRSLQRFKELPDFLQIWPAHGAGSACGKSLGAVPSSTVGYEKRYNWALKEEDPESFKKELLNEQPEPPHYFAVMKRVNNEGPELISRLSAPGKMKPSKKAVDEQLERGATVIDTRAPGDFASGHLPGTINIPYTRFFTNWAGWLIDYDRPVYLIADPDRVNEMKKDLYSIGIDHLEGYFDLSVIEKTDEKDLEQYRTVSPDEAAEKVKNGDWEVVDVRMKNEWDQGHISGARHIILGDLKEKIKGVPKDKPILVHCKSGGRSAIAASLLQAEGIKNVINLRGGFDAWKERGLPKV